MKTLTAILCTLVVAPLGLAAPIVTHDKTPSHFNDASSHMQQTTQSVELHQTRPYLLPFFATSRVPAEKRPKVIITEDGQRMQVPDNLAGARSWETPNVLHFLSSLAHPKKLSPFPESSIMREETRANNAEIEPQLTIVELETKAERESWTYLPYVTEDNVLHFKCVHKVTDKSVLLPLIAVPMLLIGIILVTLLSVLRHLYRSVCSAERGAIRLGDEETATPSRSLKIACPPQEPQVLKPDLEVDSLNDCAIDEKSYKS
ncbi:uncharacterized protein GGS22DRAFT_187208 [Annulohypoxylon maeteangense]|uniref:uncharacterized protein n=1 Tax=Annulohypoxylon maeteangense TaxID=1927788 RepID=UPI0020080634|nr:uncharacterized protein GGS22DRAFT_187208 [Annulohypoxylon maeteangense]KAI0885977.1 hypothetical protein GGS22DRAFT_187208 [Annulohypoxylon maeteangense]